METLETRARFRLKPGFHLVPAADGRWLVLRPDGVFVRLKVPARRMQELAEELLPEKPGSAASKALDADLETLLGRFAEEGIVEVLDEGPPPDRPQHRVRIEGSGLIADRLADLLRTAGLEPGADEQPDLLVCCADWLPDGRWRDLDAWCLEHGVAWHGLYAEGNRFHLGPMWLPEDPATARYDDTRLRRLAAAPHPEGLEAYWAYLDAGRCVPRIAPPTVAEATLLAATLATDIELWSSGRRPPSHGHQLAYDRTTGHWKRHPVLPVPRGLMTECIPG